MAGPASEIGIQLFDRAFSHKACVPVDVEMVDLFKALACQAACTFIRDDGLTGQAFKVTDRHKQQCALCIGGKQIPVTGRGLSVGAFDRVAFE